MERWAVYLPFSLILLSRGGAPLARIEPETCRRPLQPSWRGDPGVHQFAAQLGQAWFVFTGLNTLAVASDRARSLGRLDDPDEAGATQASGKSLL